jgi:NAD(P)H-hydrate repair Nnr-like enzyme with NAD(P)H-hydrate dehydratase domain
MVSIYRGSNPLLERNDRHETSTRRFHCSIHNFLRELPKNHHFHSRSRKPEGKKIQRKERKMAKDQYLAGQVAIVTGSSKLSGIGAATAIALAEHGANVPHLARPSKSSFADLAD